MSRWNGPAACAGTPPARTAGAVSASAAAPPLFFEFIDSGKISIAAGTLDGKTGLTTAFGIFADDKGDYYDLPDRHHFPAESDNRAPLPPKER